VEILGVAYKDRPAATMQFLNGLGDPFSAVGQDPEGRFALELGIVGVPETFVIGADGTIRAVHRGPLTPEVVEEVIRPALNAR
jgi:cytochrome c biogenesis protein CcmG/thiol:disulfide interchange protein DsbE